jgi:hypothetical protein
MASDPTLKTQRSDKPCAQPICRHGRSAHLDGGTAGDDHHCRLCKCSAYVSAPRMFGRRVAWALLQSGKRPGTGGGGMGGGAPPM